MAFRIVTQMAASIVHPDQPVGHKFTQGHGTSCGHSKLSGCVDRKITNLRIGVRTNLILPNKIHFPNLYPLHQYLVLKIVEFFHSNSDFQLLVLRKYKHEPLFQIPMLLEPKPPFFSKLFHVLPALNLFPSFFSF